MVRGETDKSSNDYQTRSCMATIWTKIGKSHSESRKQEWKNEKPKLDSARRLCLIYFIDPEDQDYNETLKTARKKLERPMAPAIPCKKTPNGITKVVAKVETASEKVPQYGS